MSRVLFDIFDFINYLLKTLCKEVLQCLVMIGVQIQLQNDFVKILYFLLSIFRVKPLITTRKAYYYLVINLFNCCRQNFGLVLKYSLWVNINAIIMLCKWVSTFNAKLTIIEYQLFSFVVSIYDGIRR